MNFVSTFMSLTADQICLNKPLNLLYWISAIFELVAKFRNIIISKLQLFAWTHVSLLAATIRGSKQWSCWGPIVFVLFFITYYKLFDQSDWNFESYISVKDPTSVSNDQKISLNNHPKKCWTIWLPFADQQLRAMAIFTKTDATQKRFVQSSRNMIDVWLTERQHSIGGILTISGAVRGK